ncbi:hypothetical protein DFH06DRAFT_1318833 [Mycena polygramma]|nr:hypothetical protein DFH06DRAFT_1318833 [Mycena polygramma]
MSTACTTGYANCAGGEYDTFGRRKGAPSDACAGTNWWVFLLPFPLTPLAHCLIRHRSHTPGGGADPAQVAALTGQVRELSAHLEGLEKERDFHFEKLREIEILVQQQVEVLEGDGKDDETLRKIQTILYSTEEGFEVPEGEDGGLVDEEETF